MADPCNQGATVVVWTFLITGGDEHLQMTLPNNPPLVHDGHRTVWKLLGTERLASAAEEIIKAAGATVQRWAEVQTKEQTEERQAILGLLNGTSTSSDPTK